MSKEDASRAYLEASEEMGDNQEPNPIQHPEILTQQVACWGCPESHEGTLLDGRYFVFRYRRGLARLGIGWTEEQASMGGDAATMLTGDDLQGVFFEDRHRNETFAALLARVYH
jgi:hypothetical protein